MWTALRRVVVETWVDCCPVALGAPRLSEAMEYMDMRLLAMTARDRDDDGPERTVTSKFYKRLEVPGGSAGGEN